MLPRLNAHRAWANRFYVEWIGALAPAEEYCHKMLSHVLRVEDVWLTRLRGETPDAVIWETLPVEALDPLRRANDVGLEAVLHTDVDRLLSYRRFDGGEAESTVADILSQVFTHGVYHRGQIASQAARLGLPKIPATDFILFARL